MKVKFFSAFLLLLVGVLLFSCTQKEAYKKELVTDGYKIVLISDQPPHVGINKWKVYVYTTDGSAVTDASVKINGYMPPMPGMPEMSFDYPVKNTGQFYESDVNLSMNGTWQITIVVVRDGKEESVKFGFNL
ncbi:FixH family protein [Persephonella sp.]